MTVIPAKAGTHLLQVVAAEQSGDGPRLSPG